MQVAWRAYVMPGVSDIAPMTWHVRATARRQRGGTRMAKEKDEAALSVANTTQMLPTGVLGRL